MSSDEKQTLSMKLENSFLGILRVVILIVLTVSLIGAAVFAFKGVTSLNATPAQYKHNEPNIQEMVDEIKKTLEQPQAAPAAPAQTSTPSQEPAKDDKLDQEVDKQFKLLSDFLQRYNKHYTDPAGMRRNLKNSAQNNAFDPQSEESVLSYATGRTLLLNKLLTDQAILDVVSKKSEEKILSRNGFFSAVNSVYPAYFVKEKKKAADFEREEQSEAIAKQSGAMMSLYIAGGMFAAFLVISLILVLVKIERNLRVRPI